MNDKPIREFTPSKRPYIVFFVIFFLPSVLMFAVFFLKTDSNALGMGLVCILVILSFWLWLFHNRVSFYVDGIAHGRFSIFRRYLAFSEMKDFYSNSGLFFDSGRSGIPLRIVIEPKPDCHKPPIIFPIRIFSQTDYQTMIELLLKQGISKVKGNLIVRDSVVKTLFARRR